MKGEPAMADIKDIKVKAVALGVLTDLGGTLVGGSAFGIISGLVFVFQGFSPNELMESL
jgi:hypothetical protein